MSEAAYEALEAEAYGDAEGEAEAYEGEAYGDAWGEAGWEGYGEASRADARRRRQQQIMQARHRQRMRQRQLELRRAPQPPRPAQAPYGRPSPATVTALRAVDLDNKVEQDSLRRAIDEANRRASRSMYSALATGAVSQALDTYQDNLKDHAFIRAAARFAPLAILPGDQKRKGVEAVLLHPAFLSGALIGGIFLIGKVTNAVPGVHDIRMAVPNTIKVDDAGTLEGFPVDRNNRRIPGVTVIWKSSDNAVLQVREDGTFEAKTTGKVVVTATAGDVPVLANVEVVYDDGAR